MLPESRIFRGLVCAAVISAAAPAPVSTQQSTLRKRMVAATVRVIVEPSGTGSGVLLGRGNYVATNLHVITDGSTGGIASGIKVAAIVDNRVKVVSAREVWHAQPGRRDVAILELSEPMSDTAPAISLSATQTDQVWAVGFPGVTDLARMNDTSTSGDDPNAPQQNAVEQFFDALRHPTADLLQPTVNVGTVARVHDSIPDFGNARVVQHQAPINKGNSGGPLFDDCGGLLGLNVAKTDLSRATEEIAQGTNFAIHSAELVTGLRELRIPYTPAGHCESTAAPEASNWPLWLVMAVSILTAGAALVLAITPRGRAKVRQVSQRWSGSPAIPPVPNHHAHSIPPVPGYAPPTPPMAQGVGRLRCVSGEFAGLDVEVLRDDPITIGRDPTLQGLVFDKSSAVSKRHCEVRYDLARRRLTLTDLNSSNGTFLAGGERLKPYVSRELRAGDRFYLASSETMFEVQDMLR